MAEASRPCISVLTPGGNVRVLIEGENLWGGDGLFVTADRYLYVPISQSVTLDDKCLAMANKKPS